MPSRAFPDRLGDALVRCAEGELAPTMALMQILVEAADAAAAEAVLARARAESQGRGETAATARLGAALALLRAEPRAAETVNAVIGLVSHNDVPPSPEAALEALAAAFDRAAAISPEASVALYSLGSPKLLQAATDEIVTWMRGRGLLGLVKAVLDVGCGIGRFEAALAGEVGAITGIDISRAMIAQAKRRCAGIANVRLLHSDGRDLSAFSDTCFDLVLAVDSFPYLVQAGMALARAHIAEAARVLAPGGHCLILNFSYRGNAEADRCDLSAMAEASGLRMIGAPAQAFALWDGLAFQLAKPEASPSARPSRPA